MQASSKGLKLYLTVNTNLPNQDIGIDTYQYGNRIYSHSGFINTGTNEITLNYPRDLVDNGPFRICIGTWNDGQACGDGYNSEEKKPEGVYVSLYVFAPPPEDTDQSQSQSQDQQQTVIVCPANARCVIEQ